MKRALRTRIRRSARFNYLYRDTSNYKRCGSVVFSNPKGTSAEKLTLNIERVLGPRSYFPDVLEFHAERVGLPTLFLYEHGHPTMDDVDFHEFHSVESSDSPPDDREGRSIDQFLRVLARSCAGEVIWRKRAGTD